MKGKKRQSKWSPEETMCNLWQLTCTVSRKTLVEIEQDLTQRKWSNGQSSQPCNHLCLGILGIHGRLPRTSTKLHIKSRAEQLELTLPRSSSDWGNWTVTADGCLKKESRKIWILRSDHFNIGIWLIDGKSGRLSASHSECFLTSCSRRTNQRPRKHPKSLWVHSG